MLSNRRATHLYGAGSFVPTGENMDFTRATELTPEVSAAIRMDANSAITHGGKY